MKPGRNDPCPCGSGRKFKNCCEGKIATPKSPPPNQVNELVALYNARRYPEMEARTLALLRGYPGFGFAWKLLGAALQMQGKSAVAAFQKNVQLTPEDAEAHFNLGVALKREGRFEEAAASYRRALALRVDYAEAHSNLGNVLKDLGQADAAVQSLNRAVQIKPDSPDAHNNLGTVLKDMGKLEQAIACFRKALAIRPNYDAANYNLGNALQKLGQSDEAVKFYRRAIELQPGLVDAHNNLGTVLKSLGQLDAALASYDSALAINSGYAFLYGARLHTKMFLCDWSNIEDEFDELASRIRHGEKAAYPFPLLAITDSLAIQRQAAEAMVTAEYPANPALGEIAERPAGERIRIGYYSADFHNHATAYLTAEMFELHDKERFELIAFSFGPDKDDEMRHRIHAAFDRFIDVRAMSDKEIAQLSREIAIDIAVDLKGYTLGSRPGIFAYRAAPVQASYIGYPGTSGAEYIDYLIADKTLIPDASQQNYSEKIVYLPDSYQVNDSKRQISEKQFTRAELGLPDNAFVFCCFNNNFKITPRVFDRWMRILLKVDGSVLWLLEDNPTAAANLKKEAEARRVNPERLVFAGRMPLAEHLARHRFADLFLDTIPYNAHTTTSDALWAGLPVLTCAGESFASRVAASLLNAVGLPELVVRTLDEYEARAIELATHPENLESLRTRLAANALNAPLFDSRRFTRNIEDAYTQMSRRYHRNLLPEHIHVQ